MRSRRRPRGRTHPRGRAHPRSGLRAALAFVALVLTLFTLCGCESLHGIGDVALEYRVVDDAGAAAMPAAALSRAVATRLGAGRIAADISVEGSRLRVVVDQMSAPTVREFLRWRGGVDIAAESPDEKPVEDRIDGVARAIDERAKHAPPDARVRHVLEPLGPERARSRVIHTPPVLAIERTSITRVVVGPEGRSLSFELDEAGRLALDRALEMASDVPLFVVRDDTVLGRLERKTLRGFSVPVGEGLYAYTRADRVRALLVTPTLPLLEPVGASRLPEDWFALAMGLFLPIVLSFGWLTFVRRFDRLHPEPMWLVAAVFGLGILSVVPAAFIEVAWARSSIALNPTYASMGGRLSALPYALLVFTLVVGLTEEGVKLLAAAAVRKHREFDEPIDGIVYGVAAALGFAAAENIRYFATGRMAPALVLARTFTSIPAHVFLGAIWGFALGQTLLPGRSKFIVVRALAIAALLHGAFDALLSTRGLAPAALLLNLGLASTFVVLVRRALRRGAVDYDAAPLSVERNTVITVGSPLVFWLGAAGVHAAALFAVVLGSLYEGSGSRPGPWFFAAGTLAFAVLVISAWALSATLPLDVVVDIDGVTFAGSLRRWERIEAIAHMQTGPLRYLRLDSPDGELRIGPVSKRDVAALEALLARASHAATS